MTRASSADAGRRATPWPPTRPRRTVGAAVALLAAIAGLAACSPGGSIAGSRTGSLAAGVLPDGVTVELRQLRSDVADRTAQVRIVNGTTEALEIDGVEFSDSRFAGPAVRDRHSTVAPGRTVDLRISLPVSACSDAADGPPSSEVAITLADGTVRRAGIPDPLGFLPPLHDRECLARRVGEVAALDWRGFSPGDPDGELSLGIRPAGGDHLLELVAVRETNLLQFGDAARSWPLGVQVDPLGPDDVIAVPIVPARCDPHAVQEDKRGTVFTLDIRLDGIDGTVQLAADDALRGELLTWVGRVCGFPAA